MNLNKSILSLSSWTIRHHHSEVFTKYVKNTSIKASATCGQTVISPIGTYGCTRWTNAAALIIREYSESVFIKLLSIAYVGPENAPYIILTHDSPSP